MQMLRAELERAQAARAEATDQRAQDALDGVILALNWAIEDAGNNPPAATAAAYLTVKAPHRPQPADKAPAVKKPAKKAK